MLLIRVSLLGTFWRSPFGFLALEGMKEERGWAAQQQRPHRGASVGYLVSMQYLPGMALGCQGCGWVSVSAPRAHGT